MDLITHSGEYTQAGWELSKRIEAALQPIIQECKRRAVRTVELETICLNAVWLNTVPDEIRDIVTPGVRVDGPGKVIKGPWVK